MVSGEQGFAESNEVMVGRCYTKARRLPLVLGELSGFRLWGGPYTVPQLVTMALVLGVMLLSHPLWAHFGLLNAVLLLGVPYIVSFAVRYLHADGRNPLSVLGSSMGLLVAPSQGRIAGRPLRQQRRPVPLTGVCTITWQPAVAGGPAGVRQAHTAGGPVRSLSTGPVPEPERAALPPSSPESSAARVRVLSGVGALLAARDGDARRQ